MAPIYKKENSSVIFRAVLRYKLVTYTAVGLAKYSQQIAKLIPCDVSKHK